MYQKSAIKDLVYAIIRLNLSPEIRRDKSKKLELTGWLNFQILFPRLIKHPNCFRISKGHCFKMKLFLACQNVNSNEISPFYS